MNEETLNNLLLAVVAGSGLATTVIGWYTRQGWLMKKVIDIIVSVVEHLARTRVANMKQANKDAGAGYDLTEREGEQIMEMAKTQVIDKAKFIDSTTPFHFPSVEKAVRNDPKLVEKIEKVVQEHKENRPVRYQKGHR